MNRFKDYQVGIVVIAVGVTVAILSYELGTSPMGLAMGMAVAVAGWVASVWSVVKNDRMPFEQKCQVMTVLVLFFLMGLGNYFLKLKF